MSWLSVFLLATLSVAMPATATVCDGGPSYSNIKETDGVLWVRGKFGHSATTNDFGKNWKIEAKTTENVPPFWRKTFVKEKRELYQNVPSAFDEFHVISKEKNEELWKGSPHNLILFARDDQLFSFDGKLSYSDPRESVRLISGQIHGTSSGSPKAEIRIEIKHNFFCKIGDHAGEDRCTQTSGAEEVTGFYARRDGSFFFSTSDTIYHFDMKADRWVTIYNPAQWPMLCNDVNR